MEVQMRIQFSNEMLKTIAQRVHEARTARGILDVYVTAESIRLENISDNVAREDIIEKLVMLAGAAYVPLEFNKHAFESERACYDTTTYLTNGAYMESLIEGETVH
jgi:hypothetical protein